MTPYEYRGWKITYDATRPATGTWRAERFGVGLCHNSEMAIRRLVDAKLNELNMPPAWRQR